jgi:hypothetical protein
MRIVIKIVLKIRIKEHRVRALVDSGAKVNYLKRKLAIEINALVIIRGITPLVSLDGKRIYSYTDHIITVTAEDTQGD